MDAGGELGAISEVQALFHGDVDHPVVRRHHKRRAGAEPLGDVGGEPIDVAEFEPQCLGVGPPDVPGRVQVRMVRIDEPPPGRGELAGYHGREVAEGVRARVPAPSEDRSGEGCIAQMSGPDEA